MKSHLQSSVINKWREKNRLALPDASQQPNQPRLIQLNGIKSVNSSEVDVRWSSFGNLSMFNDIWFDRTLHFDFAGTSFSFKILNMFIDKFLFWFLTDDFDFISLNVMNYRLIPPIPIAIEWYLDIYFRSTTFVFYLPFFLIDCWWSKTSWREIKLWKKSDGIENSFDSSWNHRLDWPNPIKKDKNRTILQIPIEWNEVSKDLEDCDDVIQKWYQLKLNASIKKSKFGFLETGIGLILIEIHLIQWRNFLFNQMVLWISIDYESLKRDWSQMQMTLELKLD